VVNPSLRYNQMILLGRGKAFHFSAAPPADIHADRYLLSPDPDEVVSAVLAHAVAGRFDTFTRLIDLMRRSDDGVLWGDCAMLFAHAAPYSALRDLVDAFAPVLFQGDDVVTQQWISEILCGSGGLWAVPHVLKAFRLNRMRERYFAVPLCLSRLLEHERGPIADGPPVLPRADDLPDWFEVPAVYDDNAFEACVMARHAELRALVPDPERSAVWEGRPLSLPHVAVDAAARIEEGEDTEDIVIARLQLEAATGTDLSNWYHDHLLMNLNAAASLEALIDSGMLAGFETGRRYFFGRTIPD
jgi:hypothetical protein